MDDWVCHFVIICAIGNGSVNVPLCDNCNCGSVLWAGLWVVRGAYEGAGSGGIGRVIHLGLKEIEGRGGRCLFICCQSFHFGIKINYVVQHAVSTWNLGTACSWNAWNKTLTSNEAWSRLLTSWWKCKAKIWKRFAPNKYLCIFMYTAGCQSVWLLYKYNPQYTQYTQYTVIPSALRKTLHNPSTNTANATVSTWTALANIDSGFVQLHLVHTHWRVQLYSLQLYSCTVPPCAHTLMCSQQLVGERESGVQRNYPMKFNDKSPKRLSTETNWVGEIYQVGTN